MKGLSHVIKVGIPYKSKEEKLKRVTKKVEQPVYLNEFSDALLSGFYLLPGESFNDALARTAEAFSYGDSELAQRIYEAAHAGWFMFSSPVLSNAPLGDWDEVPQDAWKKNDSISGSYWSGEKLRGMPISCFSILAPDTINGQIDALSELAGLSVAGGGVGIHNAIRATTEKAPGPIPYMKTVDAAIGYFRQGRSRRGACAYYMDVSHPDIMEHIKFRVPSGGDSARKSDNRTQFHCAVNISDEFIQAVINDEDFNLVCPHTGEIRETLRARKIWEEILEARALTGEPYLFKPDTANRALPQSQKDMGLSVLGSNLCNEITLVTNEDRTFVCCLSSLNLEKYDEWKDTTLVADAVRFLDNVLQWFIDNAPPELGKAIFAASQERALGLGTMGWHYYLQRHGIPFESGGVGSAIQQTHIIFKDIKSKAVAESQKLAVERGEPNDMIGTGRRNSHLLAVAPNSNSSIVIQTSPSIEPVSGNAYAHSTRVGTFLVKNPYLKARLEEINSNEDWLEKQWADIVAHGGSVQHLDYLDEYDKNLFKTAFELDQHWVIEQADARQQYICQSQSLNVFFPAGVDRAYFNSVHLKAITAEYVKGMYYARMERGINADTVKEISRKALVDWAGEDCLACEG